MLPLDPRSLIAINSILGLLCAIVFLSQRRNTPAAIGGIGEWASAMLLIFVSNVMYSFQKTLPPLLGFVLVNAVLVFGIAQLDLGIRRFYGQSASYRLVLAGCAIVAVGFLVFTFVENNYRFRVLLLTATMVVIFLDAFLVLYRQSSGHFGERFAIASVGLTVLSISLRFLVTLRTDDQASSIYDASAVQLIYLGAFSITLLALSIGLILMVNERIRTTLERLANDLQEATQELRLQNEAKTRFLAYAGHDLRQPLQAMHLFLSSLMSTALNKEQQQLTGKIDASTTALSSLLNSLLDISRLDAGSVQPEPSALDVDVMLAQLMDEFATQAHTKGLRLRLWLPKDVPSALTDEKLLSSVLRNLIENAIKYTSTGGVLVALRRREKHFLIQVWDTGVGIKAEDQKYIYDEFFQVDNPQRDRSKGLGLGLSIVSRISALLDLQLSCRSRPGRGTLMEFKLQLADTDSCRAPLPTLEESALDLRGLRVLVIEDAQEVSAALEVWLTSLGATVSVHATAESALKSSEVACADVILSDYRLPGKLNGIDLLNAIRERSHIPARGILLTGDTSPQFVEIAERSGWPILFKPVDSSRLSLCIKSLLADRQVPMNQLPRSHCQAVSQGHTATPL